MKNRDIISVLNRYSQVKDIEVSISVVSKIIENKKELEKTNEVYQDTLTNLTNKYKVTITSTGIELEKVPEESRNKFLKELNELLDLECDVKIKKITKEDLGDIKITPEQYEILNFMIEEKSL